MADDDILIMKRVQAGDVEQFSELMKRYQRPLFRAAVDRLRDPDWAEDIVQETFLAAFAGRRSFNPAFSFRTWLWTILFNLCKRQWRRRRIRPTQQPWCDVAEEQPAGATDPHGNGLVCLIQAERVERIRSLLATLPEEQADALRLRFFGELTFPEIAAALGCSLNTAKSRVRYGLEKIGRSLRSDEGGNL